MSAAWTDLGHGVHVRQSMRYAMNSVALLHPEHVVLVDPGILPAELDDIRSRIAAVAPQAVTVIFTHHHWDHVLGRAWWPHAETLAHDAFAAGLNRDLDHVRAEAEKVALEAGERWPAPFQEFDPDHAVSGLHFRRIGPWRLVLRSAPGHCPTQLNVHLPEARVLIASDMLSDLEIPGLDEPPDVYRTSLDALLPIANGGAIETLIPGHGEIVTGKEAVLDRLGADLDYLDAIEDGVRRARVDGLDSGAAVERLSAMDYRGKHATEYPTEPLHRRNVLLAWRAAEGNKDNRRSPGR